MYSKPDRDHQSHEDLSAEDQEANVTKNSHVRCSTAAVTAAEGRRCVFCLSVVCSYHKQTRKRPSAVPAHEHVSNVIWSQRGVAAADSHVHAGGLNMKVIRGTEDGRETEECF